MAGSGTGCGGCRGPARPRAAERSRALGDDARVRRRDVPRGDVQERPQPRSGRLGDAVRLDGQPLPRMHACMCLLLESRHPRPHGATGAADRSAIFRSATRSSERETRGAYRRYIRTTGPREVGHAVKRAYRVTLADGTELVASGDHRFLSDRGWKHVTGSNGRRRPTPISHDEQSAAWATACRRGTGRLASRSKPTIAGDISAG